MISNTSGTRPQSKWKTFELFPGKDDLPSKTPCVYAVYVGGVLSYVGQTVCLRGRFRAYNFRYAYGPGIITPWGDFESGTQIKVKARFTERLGDWAMREIRLIARLQPQFNMTYRKRSLRSKVGGV